MSVRNNKVECKIHGTCSEAFVCKHLLKGEKIGFNYGYDSNEPDNLFPDAWCDECEKIREVEGKWNDASEAFAEIKLLCSSCYEIVRERNWIEDKDKYHEFICSCVQHLEKKQSKFMEKYHIGEFERWDWDQATGKLIFSHEGIQQVETNIDFVGSISTTSNTWMWAWANNSLDEKIKSKSRQIRQVGEQLGYMKLATPHWEATEEDGWEMTATMMKALDAIGAYRTPNDTGYIHMIITKARWLNN